MPPLEKVAPNICNPPLRSALTRVPLDIWLIKVKSNIIIKYPIYFIISKQWFGSTFFKGGLHSKSTKIT